MGIYNATVIYERIVGMAYQGRMSILRDYIHLLSGHTVNAFCEEKGIS